MDYRSSSDEDFHSEVAVVELDRKDTQRGMKRRRVTEGGRRRESWHSGSRSADGCTPEADLPGGGSKIASESTPQVMSWFSGHFHDGQFTQGGPAASVEHEYEPAGSQDGRHHSDSSEGEGEKGDLDDRWAWLDNILPVASSEGSTSSSSCSSAATSCATLHSVTSMKAARCERDGAAQPFDGAGAGKAVPDSPGSASGVSVDLDREAHAHARHDLSPASSSTTGSESSLPPLVPELVGTSAVHDEYEDPMATWEEQQFAKMRRKHSTGAIIIDQSNAMSRYIQPVFSEPGAKDEWGWYVEEPENSPPKTSLWRPFNGHNEF